MIKKDPLFLVSLKKDHHVNEMYKLKYLLSYTVTVEPYKSPTILQCFMCQRLGHSQKNLFELSKMRQMWWGPLRQTL